MTKDELFEAARLALPGLSVLRSGRGAVVYFGPAWRLEFLLSGDSPPAVIAHLIEGTTAHQMGSAYATAGAVLDLVAEVGTWVGQLRYAADAARAHACGLDVTAKEAETIAAALRAAMVPK